MASLACLAKVFYSHPLGNGIADYDLTSPNAALKSLLEIQVNEDFRAKQQIDHMKREVNLEERLRTVEAQREAEANGKKLLFITFQDDGITKHDVAAFEKDATSGLWYPTSTYGVDDDVREQISEWRAKDDGDD